MSASITAKEVKDHASPDNGLYIIIDNAVYSMAEFADEHPGGAKILKRVGGKGIIPYFPFPSILSTIWEREEIATECVFGYGVVLTKVKFTDASKQFWKYHNEDVLKKYQKRLKVGELKEEAKL